MSSYLLDTNILLRSVQKAHPMQPIAQAAIETLLARGDTLHVVPQVLYEFYVVCTRPAEAENGIGMTCLEAIDEMQQLVLLFALLEDNDRILNQWGDLLIAHRTVGKPAHDTRLVAAMLTHGITHLLSFNGKHFERYTEITVEDPRNFTP